MKLAAILLQARRRLAVWWCAQTQISGAVGDCSAGVGRTVFLSFRWYPSASASSPNVRSSSSSWCRVFT